MRHGHMSYRQYDGVCICFHGSENKLSISREIPLIVFQSVLLGVLGGRNNRTSPNGGRYTINPIKAIEGIIPEWPKKTIDNKPKYDGRHDNTNNITIKQPDDDFEISREPIDLVNDNDVIKFESISGSLCDEDKLFIEKNLKDNLDSDGLFVDPQFVPNDRLLNTNNRNSNVEWIRPSQVIEQPKLIVDGINPSDVIQGNLGDCWLISACAAIAREEQILTKVLPFDQPLYGSGYRGIIIVHFWIYGKWHSVVIDDRLPSKNGRLIYARGNDEFWISYIEKAYAKLYGSYANIVGGLSMTALVHLSGGLTERHDSKEVEILRNSLDDGAFVTASVTNKKSRGESVLSNGLVAGHAYTILHVHNVHLSNKTCVLVCVRNPWANKTEWKGDWSDNDKHWKLIRNDEKEEIESLIQQRVADGAFWMSDRDFNKSFDEYTICTINPDFDKDGRTDSHRSMRFLMSRWETDVSAGGCRNDMNRFVTNPQFLFEIRMEENERETILIISLTQERHLSNYSVGLKQIGFLLYQVPSDFSTRLGGGFLSSTKEIGSSGTFINYPQITDRFKLSGGKYVLIPSTFQPNHIGLFTVSAYATEQFTLKELSPLLTRGELTRATQSRPVVDRNHHFEQIHPVTLGGMPIVRNSEKQNPSTRRQSKRRTTTELILSARHALHPCGVRNTSTTTAATTTLQTIC
ncbi:hypothetical protein SNEBB_003709 [Seison nebaliae]|nr:hypothetical protein SNEBB_003709 [Seison nebaliae]